jgi:hypothetical protein
MPVFERATARRKLPLDLVSGDFTASIRRTETMELPIVYAFEAISAGR